MKTQASSTPSAKTLSSTFEVKGSCKEQITAHHAELGTATRASVRHVGTDTRVTLNGHYQEVANAKKLLLAKIAA